MLSENYEFCRNESFYGYQPEVRFKDHVASGQQETERKNLRANKSDEMLNGNKYTRDRR